MFCSNNSNLIDLTAFTGGNTFIFYFFFLAFCLFFIGISGIFLNKRSLLHVFLFFEITFLGSTLFFIGLGVFFAIKEAFILALLLLAISAVELSLALTFIVAFFKIKKEISVFSLKKLKK